MSLRLRSDQRPEKMVQLGFLWVKPGGLWGTRAISPDAHCGHPALRSLDAALAFAILASLGQQRRSIGTSNPSDRRNFWNDRFGPAGICD